MVWYKTTINLVVAIINSYLKKKKKKKTARDEAAIMQVLWYVISQGQDHMSQPFAAGQKGP